MKWPWQTKPPVVPEPEPQPATRRGFFHAYFEGRRGAALRAQIEADRRRTLEAVDGRVQQSLVLCPRPIRHAAAVIAGTAMDASESGQTSLAKIGMIGNRWSMSDVLYAWYGSHTFIGHQACAFLAQHWLINKACSIPARDAVRNGFEIISSDGEKIDADRIKKIERLNKRYRLRAALTEFVRLGRVFGVRVLLFKVDPGNVPLDEYYAQPFNIDAVKPGSYKGLVQIDPYWCNPFLDTDEALRPDSLHFYEPTWWIIGGRKVHRTHLAIFRNAEVPDILKPAYLYGGVPVPQLIMERVYAAERVANEMPLLATSKRQTILKTDVEKAFANKDIFDANLQHWVNYRDNFQVKVCDGESEDIIQLDTALTDLDNVVMTSYQLVAAAADVPVTKLLGTSPKGFNATGEYDEASYHETLESVQEHDLTPIIDRHHQLLCRSEGIGLDLAIEWNPLDSPTAEEAANVQRINAERDDRLFQIGAIDQYDVRDRLIQDNQSGYTWLEMVERPAEIDLEPEPPPPMPGAGGHEGGEPPETGGGAAQAMDGGWKEDDHPRKDDGKFGKGGSAAGGGAGEGEKKEETSAEEKQRKIDSVNIDFDRDNVLPELNKEDREALGIGNKPVLLKKDVIEKNERDHPDVRREDAARIIGQSLYNPDGIFPGNPEKPYFNFIARIGEDKSTVTLLEIAETKDNLEIVHWHTARNRTRAQLKRKGERIKNGG